MSETPYLSIVATARNDNHGGNMLRRMQIFINGLLYQCQQYKLPAELIIVEWNPPVDKPLLEKVLSWPIENNPCKVRIIEVPPEIHRRFKHSEGLPLFQMIAKNVGIRRAKGEFILATNIDLLFSNELFSFLASRQLQPGVMYRIDRYDVRSDVPLEASLEEQLAYCQENLIRVNGRYGTKDMKRKRKKVEPVKQPEVVNNRWLDKVPDSVIPMLLILKNIYKSLVPISMRYAILGQLSPGLRDWLIRHGLLNVGPIPDIHTNACGDFTLMANSDWLSLGGYAELEMYSFHIDSILCCAAALTGLKERVLDSPMELYHIEHGGGCTPKTEKDLDKNLNSRGVPKMTNEQLFAVVNVMTLQAQCKQNCWQIFNDENWGLVREILPEKTIVSSQGV